MMKITYIILSLLTFFISGCNIMIDENNQKCPCSKDYICCETTQTCQASQTLCEIESKLNVNKQTLENDFSQFEGYWNLKGDCLIDGRIATREDFQAVAGMLEALYIEIKDDKKNIIIYEVIDTGLIHPSLYSEERFENKKNIHLGPECIVESRHNARLKNNIAIFYSNWDFKEKCSDSSTVSGTSYLQIKADQLSYERVINGIQSNGKKYGGTLSCELTKSE